MTTYPLPQHHAAAPHFSLVSLLAVIAATASFFVGWGAGLFLAIAGIVLGTIGILLSLLPSTRGGILSILAVLGGLTGIIAAAFRLAM